MEADDLLPSSHEPSVDPYPEPGELRSPLISCFVEIHFKIILLKWPLPFRLTY